MGHVRDLPKSKMGVDLETTTLTPTTSPSRARKRLIAELQEAADKSKKVYLATDPDREGEAISWHLKELLNLPDGEDQPGHLQRDHQKSGQRTVHCRTPGTSTRTWWTPSRPAAFWTASWATSSPRCCGRRSAGACPPAGCSLLPPGWWSSGRRRSGPSSPEEYWTLEVTLDRVAPNLGSLHRPSSTGAGEEDGAEVQGAGGLRSLDAIRTAPPSP